MLPVLDVARGSRQADGNEQSELGSTGEDVQQGTEGPRIEGEGPRLQGTDPKDSRGADVNGRQGAHTADGDESGDGEWEVAARSGMAARRRRRRARRYAVTSAHSSVRCGFAPPFLICTWQHRDGALSVCMPASAGQEGRGVGPNPSLCKCYIMRL